MDETKKALLSIDIDTAALTQNVANAKASVADLTEQLKKLKDAGKEGTDAFKETSDKLKEAGEQVKKNTDIFNTGSKAISGAADTVKGLSDGLEKLKEKYKSLSAEQGKTDGIKQQAAENKKANKELVDGAVAIAAYQQKLAEGKDTNKNLHEQFHDAINDSINLTDVQRKNGVEVSALTKKKLDLLKQIKNNEAQNKLYELSLKSLTTTQESNAQKAIQAAAAAGEHQKATDKGSASVAEYTDKTVKAVEAIFPFSQSIGEATKQFGAFRDYTTKVNEALSAFKKGGDESGKTALSLESGAGAAARGTEALSKGAGSASVGFQGLGKAIIGTGIGLLIVAVAALVNYFMKFEPVMKLVDRGMAALNGVFDLINRTVLSFVENLKGVGDFFSKIGNFLAHPIESLKSFGKEMANAATEAYNLKKAQQELDKSMQADGALSAQSAAKIADLTAQSHKKGISVEERKRLLKEIAKAEEDDFSRRKSLANQSLELALSGAAKQNKLSKDEIKMIRDKGEVYFVELQKKKNLNKEEIDIINQALNKEAELSQEASKKLQKSYEEDESRYKVHFGNRAKIKKESDDAKKKKAKEVKDRETADANTLYNLKTEAEIKAAEENFEAIFNLKKDQIAANKKFETEQENLTQTQINIITEKYRQQDLENNKEHQNAINNQAREQAAKTLNEQLASDQTEINNQKDHSTAKLNAELKYLEDKHTADILSAGNDEAQLALIDAQYAIDKKAINEEILASAKKTSDGELTIINKKLTAYQAHFSKLASLYSKNTEVGKAAFMAQRALAAAEIAINTEKQVSSIYTSTRTAVSNDMQEGPIIGPIHAAIDIAIGAAEVIGTIANGIKQATTVNSTNAQGFASGGLYSSDGYGAYLTGQGTGTSDSINARLSNGESVINARSTEMFAPILSAINQAGGGRAFNTTALGNGYALGGLFSGSNTLNDGYNELAQTRALNEMAKTLAANMPRQILVVEDVQAGLQNKALLQSMSNF